MAKKIDINDVDYSRFLPAQDCHLLAKRDDSRRKLSPVFGMPSSKTNRLRFDGHRLGDDEVFETSYRVKVGSKVYLIEKDYMPMGEAYIIIKILMFIYHDRTEN